MFKIIFNSVLSSALIALIMIKNDLFKQLLTIYPGDPIRLWMMVIAMILLIMLNDISFIILEFALLAFYAIYLVATRSDILSVTLLSISIMPLLCIISLLLFHGYEPMTEGLIVLCLFIASCCITKIMIITITIENHSARSFHQYTYSTTQVFY